MLGALLYVYLTICSIYDGRNNQNLPILYVCYVKNCKKTYFWTDFCIRTLFLDRFLYFFGFFWIPAMLGTLLYVYLAISSIYDGKNNQNLPTLYVCYAKNCRKNLIFGWFLNFFRIFLIPCHAGDFTLFLKLHQAFDVTSRRANSKFL